MLCTGGEIRGEHANRPLNPTRVESEVALALLPFGADIGDSLKFENYEFSRV